MRVLKESEIQAVSGGGFFDELGAKVVGDSAPTALKAAVGAVISPFVLAFAFILYGSVG